MRVGTIVSSENASKVSGNCESMFIRKTLIAMRRTMNTVQRVCRLSQVHKVPMSAAALASIGLLTNGALVQLGAAQEAGIPPPEFSLRDENYVDLVSFSLNFDLTDLSIGSKEHPLTHELFSGPLPDSLLGNGYFRDSFYALRSNPPPMNRSSCRTPNVIFGNETEYFYICSGVPGDYAEGLTGSTLDYNIYTRRDGTEIIFSPLGPNTLPSSPQRIQYPDGRVLTYGYCASGPAAGLLCSVTRSDGLQFKYNYTTLSGYLVLANIVAINNAYEYCDPTASACTLSKSWPTVTYAWSGQAPGVGSASILTVTDPAGRQTRYTQDSKGRTVGIKLPSSAGADNLTYTYCDNSSNWCSRFVSPWDSAYQNYVQSVVRDGQPWTYSGQPGAGNPETGTCGLGVYSVTSPAGGVETVYQNYCFPAEGGRRLGSGPGVTPFIQLQTVDGTKFSSGASLQNPASDYGGRIYQVTKPEGNQVNYTWDNRGNITQEVMVPKPGSPLPDITLSANYDATCTNPLTCNEPNWVKDGNGNETDYTYNPSNGRVATVMLPAGKNGIRRQINYTYSAQSAYVLNASGQQGPKYVASAPIWVRATKSYCLTSPASTNLSTGQVTCAGGASDELLETFYYGPNSGPNNLFLRGVATTSNGVTHVTCYGYDRFGNRTSVTTPNAGLSLSSCDQFTAQ